MSLEKLSRPESLAEMAQRELRNAIIEGRLKLGDQLSEIRLSRMLGISKTPVREALMQLRREGLVQIDPQRLTGMVLLGIDSPLQSIVVGTVLVIAVWLDTVYRKRV